MGREIKFRAWDKSTNTMLEDVSTGTVIIYGKPGESAESKNCVFMQYTGLKDKNGKSIFEGDIIINKLDINDVTSHDGVSTVTWEEGAFYARGNNHCNLAGGYFSYFEVIGNIYEHPNLLA